jgi:hypothetical protein
VSPILGHWQGKIEQQTAVELNIHQAPNGQLSGTAEFPLLIRQSDGIVVAHRSPLLPMSEVSFDGKVLRFSVMRIDSRTNPPDRTRLDFVMDLGESGTGTLHPARGAQPIAVARLPQ